MGVKEEVSETKAQIKQTILIIALIAAKLITAGFAIRAATRIPKKIMESYTSVVAVAKAPSPELGKFAEDIVKGWNKENWQAEADALLSINAEMKQADKAMEIMDFDKAYEHIERARKMWAASIKKFGGSKEATELLNMIINLKQRNRTAKVTYFASVKINDLSQEVNKITGRIKTIRRKEDAVGQITRLKEIQSELQNLKRDILKLKKQERDKKLIELIDNLFAICDAAIKAGISKNL